MPFQKLTGDINLVPNKQEDFTMKTGCIAIFKKLPGGTGDPTLKGPTDETGWGLSFCHQRFHSMNPTLCATEHIIWKHQAFQSTLARGIYSASVLCVEERGGEQV